MRMYKAIPYVLLIFAMVSPAFADSICSPSQFGFDLETTNYCIIQLGDDGGSPPPVDGNKLEITSNSSVFGSTLKGVDDVGEMNKITTSKVTGSWDSEVGVVNDFSSSWAGAQNTLSEPAFESIAADALDVHEFWAAQDGTDITINLNAGATQTIDVSGDSFLGANVYDITDGVIINSQSKLTLTGDEGDFFVFNISAEHFFTLNSNSIIELGGDIEASDVLWNIEGNIGSSIDDGVLIGGGSIFQGILLAPGRKVEVTQNHYFTFDSGEFMGTEAPETTEITAAAAIFEKELYTSEWGGLWGQIIAGGTINFTESDIACCPNPVPEPGTIALLSIGLAGLAGAEVRRRRKKKS